MSKDGVTASGVMRDEERRYVTLLITLVVLFVVPSFADGVVHLILQQASLVALMVASVRAPTDKRSLSIVAAVAGVLSLTATVWPFPARGPVLSILVQSGYLVFFTTTSVVVLRGVVTARHVTLRTLAAATSAYLLIGIVFGFVFSLLETVYPGSFNLPGADSPSQRNALVSDLLYFSFVTLSTLGYGDVLPVAAHARTLATFEALLGQVYLAILVGRLVALELSDRVRGKS